MKKFLLLCFILFGSTLVETQAKAATLNVGSIKIDQYKVSKDTTLGGVNFKAHYELNDNFAKQDCCQESDLRWIQRVNSSKDTGFTPSPNRPFIDPRQGQNVPGIGMGDGLPFYDVTYADAAMTMLKQNGSGQFIVDAPRVFLSRGPYSFMAETLLVCLEENMMLGILGGVKWGFEIAADQTTVTTMPLVGLSDNAPLRKSFNDALALDFPGWSIKPANELWTEQTPFVKAAVPEPSTMVMVLGSSLIFIIRRRAA